MLILSRLRLKNWRNFREVDLRLQERVFIVGPNAAGKSNLLDAIRFLRDLAKDGGGLKTAISDRGGIRKIRCLAARQQTDIELKADISERSSINEEWTHKWTYCIKFNQQGGGIRPFSPVIKMESMSGNGKPVNTSPGENYTRLEQPSMLKESGFGELREFFSSITYQHIVPQLLRYPHLFVDANKGEDLFGRAFIESLNRCNKKTREFRLRKIQKVIGKFMPMMEELRLDKDAEGRPHLQIRYSHWRPRGALQYEDQFSDGTLRLIGFMWSILDGSQPLLLEEPELSLHPFLVRALPEAVSKLQTQKGGRRQVILSTHSPDLLKNKGITLEEIVLLKPGESTEAVLVKNVKEARDLLDIGANPAEIVEQQQSSIIHQSSIF